jgi:bacteriocin-like protein
MPPDPRNRECLLADNLEEDPMSTDKPSTADSLTKASKAAGIELSESELQNVSGGKGVQKDKMQSANKQAEAVRGLL